MNQSKQTSITKTFSQEDFDSFALLSGDNNPIHTDPVFSANTRFGRTVAHGLLLSSVLRGLIDRLVPGSRLTDTALMFPAPTFADEPMLFTVATTGKNDDAFEFELSVKRVTDDVVTCQGSARVVS